MSAPVIHKLTQDTINRIAAGEVVQRPSAAIKEMLENSLDAGSTAITIVAKQGGMQMLQIQDNGHGIRRDDLEIVCERFTTSKLTKFEDLESISTFGFRGEALASITYVSHVSILSKTSDSPCAYKVKYLDGKCISEIIPHAGNNGTIITVEELFYNMPTRKAAFKNISEEYNRIMEVVSRYAIHYGNQNISFTCKKYGQFQSDVHTPNNSSILDNIRLLYGQSISRELLSLNMSIQTINGNIVKNMTETSSINNSNIIQGELNFNMSGYISNANYNNKKSIFILFINNRLVECASIKRTVDAVYSDILPRYSHPFIYLSIHMPAIHIDVNVHPTKKEVHFMFETDILEYIHEGFKHYLTNANQSRTFYTQLLLPSTGFTSSYIPNTRDNATDANKSSVSNDQNVQVGSYQCKEAEDNIPHNDDDNDDDNEWTESFAQPAYNDKSSDLPQLSSSSGVLTDRTDADAAGSKKRRPESAVAPNKLVRTDSSVAKIDSFFRHTPALQNLHPNTIVDANTTAADDSNEDRTANTYSCINSSIPGAFASRCSCCKPSSGAYIQPEIIVSSDDIVVINDSTETNIQNINTWNTQDFSFQETVSEYESIKKLLQDIHSSRHSGYDKMLAGHSFIGVVDATYSLIQSGTKIILLDHAALAYGLFRQLAIRRFGACRSISLNPPVSIREYLTAAADVFDSDANEEYKQQMVSSMVDFISTKAPMLKEYFSIEINSEGQLIALPELLNNYIPDKDGIPQFLWDLGNIDESSWNEELKCFDEIANVLGLFYSALPVEDNFDASSSTTLQERVLGRVGQDIVEKIFIPAIRQLIITSGDYEDIGIVTQLASLEQLYKVFERC